MSFLWHGLTEQGAQVPVQVDAQGRVIAVDGTPGVSNWDRTGTTLSPAVPGDSVDIGSGNITLNASGSAEFAGTGGFTDNVLIRGSATDGDHQTASIRLSTIPNANRGGSLEARPSDPASGIYDLYLTQSVSASDPADIACFKQGNFLLGGTLPSAPNISLNANGSGRFSPDGKNRYSLICEAGSAEALKIYNDSGVKNIALDYEGSATFNGNITAPNITLRSSDPKFYVKKTKQADAPTEYIGPELDLLAEIARLEALVRHLYETLRLAPPAGWPVWDGNDDVLRQLRK